MAYKFTYITVQHSGTRFLESYFLKLGFSPIKFTQRCKVCDESHGYLHEHVDEQNKSGEFEYNWQHYRGETKHNPIESKITSDGNPIVSILRHPHKTAISFLSRGYDIRTCLNMWDSLIRTSVYEPVIYYDIDCPSQYRKSHLLNIVRAVDCYKEEHEKLTDDFVSNWHPIGVYRSDYKIKYINTGDLPNKFDWGRFDRAVNWYNKKIKECIYDNFSP